MRLQSRFELKCEESRVAGAVGAKPWSTPDQLQPPAKPTLPVCGQTR